jgi:DNA-binding NtrC family response regulator
MGKLELADRGTLFLDEIGEMSIDMQVKILRFLETREIMRVGGNETLKLDVRLIAATNRDLALAVEQEKFRKDLYYRLKVVTLKVPPLRDRSEDIPFLVWAFVRAFSVEHHKNITDITPEAMEALNRYAWPGNVRELRNVIENLVIFAKSDRIKVTDLPPELQEDKAALPANLQAAPVHFESLAMVDIEKQAILHALEKAGGNRLKAAQTLGIGLRTLQKKLKDYGMTGR